MCATEIAEHHNYVADYQNRSIGEVEARSRHESDTADGSLLPKILGQDATAAESKESPGRRNRLSPSESVAVIPASRAMKSETGPQA